MKLFMRPEFALVDPEQKFDSNYGKFKVSSLERGFGTTLGNAIRRTLLSATPGSSVYAIKIKGAVHEFTSIPGIVENVTKIILNIKKLVLKINSDEEEIVELKIKSKTVGPVFAKDLELPENVEVLNQDLLIATISEGGELDLVLFAKRSRGYKTFKENKKEKNIQAGIIPIDSNYSPVIKVAYKTETEINNKTIELEQLELEVLTNGSISAMNAVALASRILSAHLDLFINLNQQFKDVDIIGMNEEEEKELDKTIEELDFSQRCLNCLRRAGIDNLRALVAKSEDELSEIKNLGRKSLKEIKDKVNELGLSFTFKN